MENVEQTKFRVLREAIRSNVEVSRGIKTRRSASGRKSILLPLGLWSFFVIASLAYFLVPSPVVPGGSASSPDSAKVEEIMSPTPVGELASAPETPLASAPEIPLVVPQPLNRAAVPLSVKKIIIDPGHGGKQHGAVSESGVSEKEITLDIGRRLHRLMKKTAFEAIMTRQTDKTLSLQKRVALANSNNADLFVSIHVNWMEPREIRPLETYYVGPTDDPDTIKLAAIENRESGYSLSDYRQLLEKIYIDTKRDESHRLAKAINTELYRSLSQVNPELENRGVKMAPFLVLVGTEMPAILVEVSCLSNEDEVRLLTNENYREKIAVAILEGIRSYTSQLNGF